MTELEVQSGETDRETATLVSAPVHAISMKPPPFYIHNPTVWFRTMESQFQLSNIVSHETRFHHVIAVLPEVIAAKLPDDLPSSYDDLKREVLAISAKSNYEKMSEAIGQFHLDVNEKPSQLLKRIQHKIRESGLANTDELVTMRFTDALPSNMKMIVAAVPGSTSDKAQVADTLTGLLQNESASTVGVQNAGTPVAAVSQFPQQRQQFHQHHQHQSQPPPPQQQLMDRGVAPFYGNQRPRVCRAHIYFGKQARRCTAWCQWPSKGNTRITSSAQATPHNSPHHSLFRSPAKTPRLL